MGLLERYKDTSSPPLSSPRRLLRLIEHPRTAEVGIGRRPKKRRVSPASTIDVEQIWEEGVETLVVAEEEKEEEPSGVVVAPSSSVIVAWCVEWVVVEALSMLDYQRDRFARYATLHVAARRLHAVEQTGEFGCMSAWASEHTFDELTDAGFPIPRFGGFWSGHGCAAAPVASVCTPAIASESASAARWRSGFFRRTVLCVCALVHCSEPRDEQNIWHVKSHATTRAQWW